ncbi:MAG: hypothetical protein AAGB51_12550 [Planctomycetota bacterium]
MIQLAQLSQSADPLAPSWLVLPLALVAMVLIAGHLLAVRGADMPESRRRIRSAADVVMLVLSPILAYAFGIATPADTRTFTLVWAACVGLLFAVILLAFLDSANNVRLHRRELRQLGREARATREEIHAALRARARGDREADA